MEGRRDIHAIADVSLLAEAICNNLPLAALFHWRATCHNMLARMRPIIAARHEVTSVDVASGSHVAALRYLTSASDAAHLHLAPGIYHLGSVYNPAHVDTVRQPLAQRLYETRSVTAENQAELQSLLDSDAFEAWAGFTAGWKEGYGPLRLRRSIVLARDPNDSSESRPTLVLDANLGSGAVISVENLEDGTQAAAAAAGEADEDGDVFVDASEEVLPPPSLGAAPLVRLDGVDLRAEDSGLPPDSRGCLCGMWQPSIRACDSLQSSPCKCQLLPGHPCKCVPYGGPCLEAIRCTIEGSLYLRGRALFEDCLLFAFAGRADESGCPSSLPLWNKVQLSIRGGQHGAGCGDRTVSKEADGRLHISCAVRRWRSTNPEHGFEDFIDIVCHPRDGLTMDAPGWVSRFLGGQPRPSFGCLELGSPCSNGAVCTRPPGRFQRTCPWLQTPPVEPPHPGVIIGPTLAESSGV
jgi:hypothetical protein